MLSQQTLLDGVDQAQDARLGSYTELPSHSDKQKDNNHILTGTCCLPKMIYVHVHTQGKLHVLMAHL